MLAAALLSLLSTAWGAPLTTAEVARHDRPDDCWTVLDGQVYDLTPWVAAHPGGDTIMRACGKDASWFFRHRDDAGGHSEGATALLPELRLGALGDDVEFARRPAPPPVHPHDARLEGSRTGILTTAGVGPARSILLRAGHHFAGDGADTLVQLGYSTGWMDVVVSDAGRLGLGGLELRGRLLERHRRGPVDLTLVGGGGFSSALDAPALYGQLVAGWDTLDRRLELRGVGTVAAAPGAREAAGAAGLGLEFRPLPLHGVFGEVNVPVADLDALSWASGLRFYTRGHAFALYASSITSLSPWSLAGGRAGGFAVGASFERAFRL